jgi:hypothetical protein
MLVNPLFSQDSLYLVATITGEQTGDQFGNVAGLGDVNGDEYGDFIVGGVEYAKIYFGGVPFDTIADLRFDGNDTLVMTSKVAGAGDVNNDGYDDVLLGGFFKNGLFPKSIVFLYYGGANMDTIPDFQFIPPYGIQDMLGQISGAGDVNNDGYDDFIVGVPYNWYDGIGRAYLFLGGDTLSNQPFLTFVSDSLEDFFSRAATGVSDINGDDFDDIAICAPKELSTNVPGIVYFYLGGTSLDSIPDIEISGDSSDYNYGKSIHIAGNLCTTNINNFIITSDQYVYVFFGPDSFISIDPIGMGFGGYISAGSNGDFNNDGYDDFLIGNTNYINKSGIMVGKVCGYYGNSNLDTIPDFCMEGETKWGEYSKYLCIGGDINNDGYDEVMVGAPNFPDHTNPLGKVYIYSYENFNSINENMVKNNITTFKLYKNYPNPFNSTTTIVYELFYTSEIKLEIYNCSGQRIKVIKKGLQKPGFYSVEWKGTSDENMQVSSGVYFIRLSVKSHSIPDHKSAIEKLVLIK